MKMDLRRSLVVGILVFEFCWLAYGSLVFPVHYKFKSGENTLSAIRAHDARRRGRFLSVVDLNLGSNEQPSETGLYYTKVGLGSPPTDYYVQVDTGSDILWVNCVNCTRCPRKSDLGIELKLYDPKGSKTSDLVSCDEGFCSDTYDGPIAGCKPDMACSYSVTYEDGGSTNGYYVKDYLTFNQVNSNLHSAPANSAVIFGCGAKQSGALGSTNESLDGILGFGQANSSVLSQLAASGKVKRIFSHCLDSIQGGGIFAVGEVVEPKGTLQCEFEGH